MFYTKEICQQHNDAFSTQQLQDKSAGYKISLFIPSKELFEEVYKNL